MTDLGEMKVKVGADISELVTGVNKAKAKVVELVTTEGDLKRKILELNAALAKNDSAFEAVNKELASLRTSAKQSSAAIATLNAEMKAMSAANVRLSATLESTKAELATTVARVEALTVAQQQAEVSGSGFTKGLGGILGGLKGIASIIPGLGFLALASLVAGPVIQAFKEWYDTLNKVSDSLKTMKANQENLNDILSSSNKEAAKQITDLKILYDAATNVNLSMKDRLAAVKGLQNEFPDYFKNIKQETILNGEAKTSYDAAADSILRMARAKAAVNKLQDIGAKQLDNDIQKQKILNATTNEATRARKENREITTSTDEFGNIVGKRTVDQQVKIIEARRDAALKIVGINAQSLKDQADFITKFIGLSDLAKGVETEIKTPKVKKDTQSIKNVETISDVLQKLAIQINFLNQKQLLLRTDESQAKINAIESTIDHLMQKFKLLSDNPVIIKLQAQAADIALQQIFKKDAADRKNLKIELPVEPEIKFADTFNEQVLRDQLLEELTRLGIKKTIPVKIGVDVTGQDIFAGSENISNNTGIKKLQETLDDAKKRIKDFKGSAENIFNGFGDSLASSLGQSLGEALAGGNDVFKGLFDSIFSSLGTQLENLGAVMIKSGIEIKLAKDAFKKLLADPILAIGVGVGLIALGALIKSSVGQSAPGFATGGYISGPGTKTSDSIPAWLSNGEFVMNADVVSKLGVGFFDKLNRGIFPKFDSFGVQKFATGGFVSPSIVRSSPSNFSGVNIGGREIFIAESKLRGQDIVTSFKRASATIARNS